MNANNKNNIDDLLKRALGETEKADPELIERVKNDHARGYQANRRTKTFRFTSRVAVIAICVLVMSTTVVAATNMFGLKDLFVKNENIGADKKTILSLQGYTGSPEYKGFAEWSEYCESYEPDDSRPESKEDRTIINDPLYVHYDCYTQEMVDKLNEIIKKYDLSLHGNYKSYDDLDEFMKSLGLENLVDMESEGFSGYSYEDGTFQFDYGTPYENEEPDFVYESDIYIKTYDYTRQTQEDIIETYGEMYATSEALNVWVPIGFPDSEDPGVDDIESPMYEKAFVIEGSNGKFVAVPYKGDYDLKKEHEAYQVASIEHSQKMGNVFSGFSLRYTVKGTLDYVGLSIDNIDDFVEWEYKTKSGVTVNMAQSDNQCILVLDTDNAFVAVNMIDSSSLSKKDLEDLVDKIDFKLLT